MLAFFSLMILSGVWLVIYLYRALSPAYSLSGRLSKQVQVGMSLHQVEAAARQLGFEWHVNAERLEKSRSDQDPAGRIICHQEATGSAGSRCQDHRDVKSFGALFSSYACLITIKDGKVAQSWFYMD